MNTIRWLCIGLNALLLASSGIGCGNRADGGASAQAGTAGMDGQEKLDAQAPPFQTTVMPIAVRQTDLPVTEGEMPLAYLIETTGGIRVVDQTTKQSLAQTTAQGRSIVSIDAVHGVSVGGIIFTPGPLPADHRYAVYFDSGGFTPEQDIQTSHERTDPAILHKHNQFDPVQLSPIQHGGSTTGPSPHN